MSFEFTGAVGEHYVLSQLLLRNIESYLAVKANQKGFDIVALIGEDKKVVRIEVKTRDLNSGSTNNSFSINSEIADFLIIVIIENSDLDLRTFVIPTHLIEEMKEGRKQLSTSKTVNGKSQIRDDKLFLSCENNWEPLLFHFN
jgi:hypothetical protein